MFQQLTRRTLLTCENEHTSSYCKGLCSLFKNFYEEVPVQPRPSVEHGTMNERRSRFIRRSRRTGGRDSLPSDTQRSVGLELLSSHTRRTGGLGGNGLLQRSASLQRFFGNFAATQGARRTRVVEATEIFLVAKGSAGGSGSDARWRRWLLQSLGLCRAQDGFNHQMLLAS